LIGKGEGAAFAGENARRLPRQPEPSRTLENRGTMLLLTRKLGENIRIGDE